MNYLDLFEKYKFPATLTDLVRGKTRLPHSSFIPYLSWLIHPPSVLPILVDESSPAIACYLTHPFAQREGSFAMMYLDSDYLTEEIALTLEQFYTYFLYEVIENNDGVDDAIRSFAQQTGITNLEELYEVAFVEVSREEKLARLPVFRTSTPLTVSQSVNEYKGNYPSNDQFLIPQNVPTSALFEIADKTLLSQLDNVPEWLVDEVPKNDLFQYYLGRGELDKAWFTVNSSGWKVSEMADAIRQLQQNTDNPYAIDVCQVWLDEAYEPSDFY